MLKALLCGETLARFLHQQVADQILCGVRNVVPYRVVKVIFHVHDLQQDMRKEACIHNRVEINLFEQSRSRVGIEGRIAAQENVDDNANAPHVDRLVVRFGGQNLGSYVTRRTT